MNETVGSIVSGGSKRKMWNCVVTVGVARVVGGGGSSSEGERDLLEGLSHK